MKRTCPLLLALVCLLLSGCMLRSPEQLYAPPKQSAEYYTLQNELERVLADGAEYCAPVSGDHRQAVQLADLDSDGQEEAVVFFRTGGQRPLKIYIYKKFDAGYQEYAVIEGEGSAFESVSYCQIDTTLGLELVVGRQVSDQVPQNVSVYSVEGGTARELLNISCLYHALADLDGNGLQELIAFRAEETTPNGMAEYYRWANDCIELSGTADLSVPLSSGGMRRILSGLMQEDVPAVFASTSLDEWSIVTDVFLLDGEEFCNACLLDGSVNGADRVRFYRVFSEDIDRDGLIELPAPELLTARERGETHPFYQIRWYNLRRDGSRDYKCITFHNYTEGWYLELAPEWEAELSVEHYVDEAQLDGHHYYFRGPDGVVAEQFALYALSGSQAEAQATADGRFLLARKGSVIYAGEVCSDAVSPQALQRAFHLIYTDWNSGEK